MEMEFYKSRAKHLDQRPHSETELAYRADFFIKEFSPRIPTKGELALLSHKYGPDLASMVLYRSICQNDLHGEFVRFINKYAHAHRKENQLHKVFISTGRCFGLEFQSGRRSEYFENLAHDALFSTDIIPTDDTDSVSTNARVLWKSIEMSQEKSIILVTFGRSSAEARMMFEKKSGSKELNKIKAWINLSGIFSGSQLYSNIFNSSWRRSWLNVLGRFSTVNINGLQELSNTYPLWNRNLRLPVGMRVVSLLGLSMSQSIHPLLKRNYKELSHFGPNDGISLSWDSIAQPGLIFPMWNTDYFLRRKDFPRIFQKILTSTAEQIEDRSQLKPELTIKEFGIET